MEQSKQVVRLHFPQMNSVQSHLYSLARPGMTSNSNNTNSGNKLPVLVSSLLQAILVESEIPC